MKLFFSMILLFFPWKIRKYIYKNFFKYDIHPSSYIGFSILYPEKLILAENARIGHLNICKNIDLLKIKKNGIIENLNWITGYPSKNTSSFQNSKDRFPALLIGKDAAITSKHSIDCTDTVILGDFSTIAGNRTEILTHSINPYTCKQECYKINIGHYNFIGTRCVILGKTSTKDYCIFGAMALLNKNYNESLVLYGGVPSKIIKKLTLKDVKYFTRDTGVVK